jgi:hypothetical protein
LEQNPRVNAPHSRRHLRAHQFNFEFFFMAFLCVSQQGEFKNTIKKLFWENTCQKLSKKVEKKNFFPVVFSHRFIFIAFLAVSLHEVPKNTIKNIF